MGLMDQGGVGRRVAKVAGAIAMLGVMFVTHQWLTQGPLFRGSDVSEQIDELAQGDQPASPLYKALKEEFPADYARFKEHLESVAGHGANPAQVLAARDRWIERFSLSLAQDVAKAPRAALFRMRDESAALVEGLSKESSSQCAQFGMTGRFHQPRPSERISRLTSNAVAAQLRAAAAGRKTPTVRGEPTEADGRELARQLERAGLKQDVIVAVFGGTAMRLPTWTQCRASVAVYKALGTISDGASERLSANMLVPAQQ